MQDNNTPFRNTGERGIELFRLLRVLWKWKFVILAVTILAGIAGHLYSETFLTPVYRSSFTAYINNRMVNPEGITQNTSNSDLTASKSLAYVYQDIISSRSVLNDAAAQCGLNYSYNTLYDMVSINIANNSAMVTVYVKAEDPVIATQLATAIAATAPGHVARVVDGSSMRILDTPVQPTTPYSPDSMRNASMCALTALAIASVIVILLDLAIDKVYSVKEMEERYGIVVVGFIPDLTQAEKYQKYYNPERKGRYYQ